MSPPFFIEVSAASRAAHIQLDISRLRPRRHARHASEPIPHAAPVTNATLPSSWKSALQPAIMISNF